MVTNYHCGRGRNFFSVKEMSQKIWCKGFKYGSLLSLKQYNIFHTLWLKAVNMLVHGISQTYPDRDKSALGLKHSNFYFINFKEWETWIVLVVPIKSMKAVTLYAYIQAVLNSNLAWATDRRGRNFVVSISKCRDRTLGFTLTVFLFFLSVIYSSISIYSILHTGLSDSVVR
jgi:hypothetical protein